MIVITAVHQVFPLLSHFRPMTSLYCLSPGAKLVGWTIHIMLVMCITSGPGNLINARFLRVLFPSALVHSNAPGSLGLTVRLCGGRAHPADP